MIDPIDRQAAIDAIDRMDIPEDMCVFEILSHIELEIGTLPSAQPKRGRWIEHNPHKRGLGIIFECSECGYEVDCYECNFCPQCGADMRGRSEDE